jgi:hypothetical protein
LKRGLIEARLLHCEARLVTPPLFNSPSSCSVINATCVCPRSREAMLASRDRSRPAFAACATASTNHPNPIVSDIESTTATGKGPPWPTGPNPSRAMAALAWVSLSRDETCIEITPSQVSRIER